MAIEVNPLALKAQALRQNPTSKGNTNGSVIAATSKHRIADYVSPNRYGDAVAEAEGMGVAVITGMAVVPVSGERSGA
jgi:hypothetical protein